ncbi:serine/threonine-protein phosphatase 7 long form homolog [Fagus crenata]
MGSKYSIPKHQDLVLGLSEKWYPQTNTFIFPWGEATVALEDMMALGATLNLLKALMKVVTIGASIASQHAWLEHFMGSWIKFEHEAFLSYWLSKFKKFPIAIHLARGSRIALAPAVLSSIYTDLGLLKQKLVASTKLDTEELWAWERFPTFRPTPISITQVINIENVRLAIDSAEENFQWRPYAIAMNHNWLFLIDVSLDKGLESFARCLRVLPPHRVAMQFGYDQDLPGHVAQYSKSPDIAWNNYNNVTTRYFELWKQSMSAQKDAVKHFVKMPRNSRRVTQVYSRKKKNYNAFVPPSSSLKCHEVDMKDPVKETKLLGTLSEKKLADDANPLSVSLSQSASHSTADVGAAKNDLLMIPMAKVMHSEVSMDEPEKNLADATLREVGHPTNVAVDVKDNDGENCSYCETEMPGLELEAWVSKLERVIAELKATRAIKKFENKPAKEEP